MSVWPLTIVSALIGVVFVNNAASGTGDAAALRDGVPIIERPIAHDVKLSFDGSDGLRIVKRGTLLNIAARTPSSLSISPHGKRAILNFGDGSGQVYDVAAYDLDRGTEINIRFARTVLIDRARRKGCDAPADSVSILFERWRSESQVEVSTEDFSRLPGCDVLEGRWIVDVAKQTISRR